ncbi:putative ATP-binding protein [Alishewanella phage vB_AspM_Slickus01]|nr:putative ATP-binding protein [Alishewanella phage vB_AspM_Slickus01]
MGNGEESMTKIFILNCPKRSGKDVVGDYLARTRLNVQTTSFKNKLIEIALNVSNISKSEWDERYHSRKDEPWELLGGLSQRQFLIKISEDWVKPVFGHGYFGKATVEKIKTLDSRIVLITDGGFNAETETLMKHFGDENVYILNWTRNGSNWDNDSRNYITCHPDNTFALNDNNGDRVKDYAEYVMAYINDILEGV